MYSKPLRLPLHVQKDHEFLYYGIPLDVLCKPVQIHVKSKVTIYISHQHQLILVIIIYILPSLRG